MFSEPVRKAAMKEAMDEGKTTLSGRVKLVQETNLDVQSGCLMYLPIYKREKPLNTVEQRREAIRGFVYSPFRAKDLMDGILGHEYPEIHISVYDGKAMADSSLLYTSVSNISEDYIQNKSLFKIDKKIFIEGHPWYIRYASLPAFEKDIDFQRPSGILFSGIVISLLLFITARTMASSWKSGKQLERLLESSGEGIFGLDTKGHCIFINNSALSMFKYTKEECIDKDMHTLTHHSKEDRTPLDIGECRIMQALHQGKEIKSDDEIFWRSDGTTFRAEYFANPILYGSEIRGIVVTFSDISKRKEGEEKLEASLREKDVLLKEIHHRVKNNLQIVASLINLQMQNLTDTTVMELLKESQNRIKSMALIHEKLYMAKNMSRINIANYISDLTRHLLRSYSSSITGINLDINVDEINIDIDKTISLGLAINEIVSNSLKHAFPPESEAGDFMPQIHLDMKKSGENVILDISDNGKGIPESFDFRSAQTLGLQLVNALVKQLDGEIKMESSNGTKFTITFPIN
jgi:PAS domain S-box-containing protein